MFGLLPHLVLMAPLVASVSPGIGWSIVGGGLLLGILAVALPSPRKKVRKQED